MILPLKSPLYHVFHSPDKDRFYNLKSNWTIVLLMPYSLFKIPVAFRAAQH